MARELNLQKKIFIHYRNKGCVVMKMPAGYQSIPNGFPDLLVLAPNGKWFALEVKATSTAPFRPLQKEWIAKLATMGYATAVNPTNWPDVQAELDTLIL